MLASLRIHTRAMAANSIQIDNVQQFMCYLWNFAGVSCIKFSVFVGARRIQCDMRHEQNCISSMSISNARHTAPHHTERERESSEIGQMSRCALIAQHANLSDIESGSFIHWINAGNLKTKTHFQTSADEIMIISENVFLIRFVELHFRHGIIHCASTLLKKATTESTNHNFQRECECVYIYIL